MRCFANKFLSCHAKKFPVNSRRLHTKCTCLELNEHGIEPFICRISDQEMALPQLSLISEDLLEFLNEKLRSVFSLTD